MADRPSDDEILAFAQTITQDANHNVPFVSKRLPIADLRTEYELGSPVFTAKIDALGTVCFHRVRGDGDCFYRAFAFGAFLHAQDDKSFLVNRLDQAAKVLTIARMVYEDFLEKSKDVLQSGDLLNSFNDAETSNSIVVFLRFLTSDYIKRHAHDYMPYIEEPGGLQQWCERYVDPMGAEADHIQISALVNALSIGVDIINLDGTDGDSANIHSVKPDAGAPATPVRLLYRPGHYDVLV